MTRAGSVDDPIAAIATAPGKRALDVLVAEPSPHALPALVALLEQPPVERKALVFFLAWAGRLALGPVPTSRSERPDDIRAALDAGYPQLAAYLDHADRHVCMAATLPLAACRGNAVAVQQLFANAEARAKHYELGAALRIASGVTARDTGVLSLVPAHESRPGAPTYYADAIARQLDGRGADITELVGARNYGERSLSRLPWFPRQYSTVLRALIMERPLAEREAYATKLVEAGPITQDAVEAVFAHREMLPGRDRAERQRSMMLLRGDELTPVQRIVMAARSRYPDRGLVGSISWPAFRVPITAFGRSIVLGEGRGPLAALVQTTRGPTPVYVALLDLLAEAMLDKRPDAKRHAAIDALLSHDSPEQRTELDRAARACDELVDASAYAELVGVGTAWPGSAPR